MRQTSTPEVAAVHLRNALMIYATHANVDVPLQSGANVIVRISYHEDHEEAVTGLRRRLARADVVEIGARVAPYLTEEPWRSAIELRVDRARAADLAAALTSTFLYPVVLTASANKALSRWEDWCPVGSYVRVGDDVVGVILLNDSELARLGAEAAGWDDGREEAAAHILIALQQARRIPLERPA